MFRVSQHPSSGVLKTVTTASGTGHNTGTVTSRQRGLIGTQSFIIMLLSIVLGKEIFQGKFTGKIKKHF